MLLYHFSNGFYSKLKDVNKNEGIWFTTDSNGYNGQTWLFRYRVNISLEDTRLQEKAEVGYETKGKVRWYAYQAEDLKYDNVACSHAEFAPLVEEIQKFRCMIEKTDFTIIPEAGCFCRFPKGCCGDTALLLWKFLQTEFCGKYDEDIKYKSGMKGKQTHAWLEFKNAIVIDITADQFPDIEEPVMITSNKRWHEQFKNPIFRDEERDFDNFIGINRDRLTKIYNAILTNN